MTRSIWKLLLGAAVACTCFNQAHAAEAEASVRALAEQVLIASGNDARLTALNRATAIRDLLIKALRNQVPASVRQSSIESAVDQEIWIEAEEFYQENVRIYATRFTQDQLRDMLSFYNSAGGKALVAQTPAIIQEKASFGRQLAQEAVPRMVSSACAGQPACAK